MFDADEPLDDTPPPPPSSPLVRIGWRITAAGAVVAFVSVGVLEQGASAYEETAADVHRLAMWTMFVGMLLALVGHRITWNRRTNPGRIPAPSPPAPAHSAAPPTTVPPVDALPVDALPVETLAVAPPLAARVPPVPLVPQAGPPTVPQAAGADWVAPLLLFVLTLGLGACGLLALLLPIRASLALIALIDVGLLIAAVVVVAVGRGVVRATGVGILAPSILQFAFVPALLRATAGSTWPSYSALDDPFALPLLSLVGWLFVVASALAGLLVGLWFDLRRRSPPAPARSM